jgi:hypothetical protein
MATKFSSIYKQELKSRGALESLGSTVVKSMAERVDLRNVLFGGKGFVAKTGRRIFGKGYDPIDRARKITPDSSAAVAAVASLQESNKRQEDALRVIVKNTMNMNMMARDMNITRQNIASLTKAVTGKSSKGADALWMNAARRDREDRSTAPTKMGGVSSSILSGVLGGVMGIGGSVGSGIFRALGSIIAISPLLGIVGIAAAGYAIKKMGESIDFSGMFDSIKESIMTFLGIDPKSEEPILKQLAKRLDEVFSTDKFTSIYGWIDENIGPYVKKIGVMVDEATKNILIFSSSAFRILGEGFGKLGEIFAFHFREFINQYKPELLATVGASIGLAIGGMFGLGPGAIAGIVSGAAGYVLGKITQSRSPEDIKSDIINQQNELATAERQLRDAEKAGPSLLSSGQKLLARKNKEAAEQRLIELSSEYSQFQNLYESMRVPGAMKGIYNSSNWNKIIEEETKKYESTSPIKIPQVMDENILNRKFSELSEDQKNALLDAQAKAEGFGKLGTLPTRMNNPGAMLYSDWQKQYGAEPGDSNSAGRFAKFPNAEMGKAAQKALWESNLYRDLSIKDALKVWTGSARNERAYDDLIVKAVASVPKIQGQQIAQGSVDLADGRRTISSTQSPTINNINNNNVTKTAAPPQPIPNAFNVDVTDLLFSQLVRGM